MTAIEEVIVATLHRCRRVAAGADELAPLLAPVLPFGGSDLAALPLETRTASIALLKRFEQLQDLLTRLVRAILAWHTVDASAMTRRDVANWMEKVALVEDADQWIALANLRNRLAHEYLIDENEQVIRVNQCWSGMSRLHAILNAAEANLTAQGLLP